jgi:hypothetical protein
MTFPLQEIALLPNKDEGGGLRANHMDDAIVSQIVNIL